MTILSYPSPYDPILRENSLWRVTAPPAFHNQRPVIDRHECNALRGSALHAKSNPRKKCSMRASKFSTALVITFMFLFSHMVSANAAVCSSGQLSSIRSAQTSLNSKQATLSRAQADLAKVNQKLNTLQQQLNKYMSMKNGSSFVASTQRQIDSALRDQGNAMSRVNSAQTFYDMSLRSYNSAAGRCTP